MSVTALKPPNTMPGVPRTTRVSAKAKKAEAPSPRERRAVITTALAVAMLPLVVPRGPSNISPDDLFIGIALTTCAAWGLTSRWRFRFPFALSICVFMTGGAIGAFAGPVPFEGAITLLQDFELLIWCWAVVNIASSPARLRTMLATWSYSSIAWTALLFVGLITGTHALTGQTDAEGSRTSLTFFDPNYSANYYFISIMMIWASRTPRHRAARVLAYVMLVIALVSTGSNSGMVSLLVGVGGAAILGIYQRRGTMAAVAATAFILVGGFFLVSNVSLSTIQEKAHGSSLAVVRDGIGRSGASVSERSKVLHESLKLFWQDNPLGKGPTSTKVRLIREAAPYVKEAHDDYFAALMERGLIGTIGLAIFLGALGVYVTPLLKDRLKPGFRAVIPHPNALVGALGGTAVAMAVYELLHVRHVWVLFSIVAAIYMWGRDEEKTA